MSPDRVGTSTTRVFDYEVWNQPIIAYETTYFNPLLPSKKSKNWREVAVAYNWQFKRQDRFQSPLTRGRLSPNTGTHDDSQIKYVVGAITTVVFLAEIRPEHSDQVQEDKLYRDTYTYDLEIEDLQGNLVASGGEWHENSHPDFLWVPQKDASPLAEQDTNSYWVNLRTEPTVFNTQKAQLSSQKGNPLCSIIKSLVFESTGTDRKSTRLNSSHGYTRMPSSA